MSENNEENNKKKNFTDDLKEIMFGFGDERDVDSECVDLVTQFFYDFVDKMVRKSMQRSYARGMYNKIIMDDLMYLIKDDRKYIHRSIKNFQKIKMIQLINSILKFIIMKIILILTFTMIISTDDLNKSQNNQKDENIQKQIKQDKIQNVELKMTPKIESNNLNNTVKLKKNPQKVQERQLREEKKMQQMRQLFLQDIDSMIKKFNLDRELDENKLDEYFKDLEEQLFNNMKQNFLKNKEYTSMYDNLVEEYNNIKKQYD